jgi:cytoskeletal protein RodZ
MAYRRETVTTEEVVETPATEPATPAAGPSSVNINAPQEPGPDAPEAPAGDATEGQTNVNIG